MQIVLIKSEKLYKYPFPDENVNSYPVSDYDENENERHLLNFEREDKGWLLVSASGSQIIENGKEYEKVPLLINKYYSIRIKSRNGYTNALILVCEENDKTYKSYALATDGEYTIGSENQSIIMNAPGISALHAVITKKEKQYYIEAKDLLYGVYVNDIKISKKLLNNGDKIFIMGFRIIYLDGYFIINNFNNGLYLNNNNILIKNLPKFTGELLPTKDDDQAKLYGENDYYYRSPRFVTSVNPEDFRIDSPPAGSIPDDTPVIYTIGPMLTMALSSGVTAATSVVSLVNGNRGIVSALPGLLIAVGMVASTILWPSLMRKYTKKKAKEAETLRQKKYQEYLTDKRRKIEAFKINQSQVLIENYPDAKGLRAIIINKKRNLWQRQVDSEDFLSVRVGLGTIPLKIKLSYSKEDFQMTTDNLKEELERVGKSAETIPNSPVTINLTERNKLVLIGEKMYRDSLLKYIILQLATYHAYTDLKLVFMVNDEITDLWNEFKVLPHVWSNSRDIRFYANNYEDMSKISFYLEQVYTKRKYSDDDGNERKESDITYRNVTPYYLLIVDNIKKNKNVEIINKVLKEKRNIGFGLIVLNDGISNLPNECNDFLMAAGEKSAIIKNDLNKENQVAFNMDTFEGVDVETLCEKLSNIPVKVPLRLDEMKTSLGFLEMFKVGKIEQLNIFDRWIKNNPVNSLNTPIGIHADGELFNLDLHEKFHGPHGLIAGMTGSGKSEFIITYILSMCLNFNPFEVSFVLIDYKGGGLTGAFENKLTGVKLPHLAGTITNLDKAEINRSLASIRSELKRRQELFNKAKLDLNESTLDIYKYQQLYRDGKLKEPISHLFIISDEFAELKSQQPDFMQELISTARIGRSLGVHLILATQKPSGIVDDQIWSNSKFKVCLKVQEKADSMDVIKCPDAAALKKAGNFYLQVGYNDYFAMGQAAYAGVKYIPRDKLTQTVDRNFSFINNIGDVTKSIDVAKKDETKNVSLGEELPNVLKYICTSAKEKHMVARKLWLDKIPTEIFVNNLIDKYKFVPKKWDITAVIGEYDDPNNQRQDLLTIDFNEKGNTLIYGASGSGKEIMLSSIIYSLIISHTSMELNIYVVDFGTEMFNIFKPAPQVGDVVLVHEAEKLNNLFGLIDSELARRKKLFVDYNGDYDLYIKNSGRTLPRMIIIINNFEAFNENYEDYVEVISAITRECERYGISFVISASGVNSVRSRIVQNFSNLLCLQFNDPGDYGSVLGMTRGLIPSNAVGRGLVKLDGALYEYQTAYPCKWDEINTFIKDICTKLNEGLGTLGEAKEVAVLPDHVRFKDIQRYITDLKNVPIGIEKDGLQVCRYNFVKNPITLISAQEISSVDKFIISLGEVLDRIPNTKFYMIDSYDNITDTSKYKNYISATKEDGIRLLDTLENALKSESETSVFMFYGMDYIKNVLKDELSNRFKDLMLKFKETKNVRMIFIDDSSKLKQYEYEDYYRDNVKQTYGIWLSTGLSDQYVIKSTTYNKLTRSELPNDFGFKVEKGIAVLIKLLDFYSQD